MSKYYRRTSFQLQTYESFPSSWVAMMGQSYDKSIFCSPFPQFFSDPFLCKIGPPNSPMRDTCFGSRERLHPEPPPPRDPRQVLLNRSTKWMLWKWSVINAKLMQMCLVAHLVAKTSPPTPKMCILTGSMGPLDSPRYVYLKKSTIHLGDTPPKINIEPENGTLE